MPGQTEKGAALITAEPGKIHQQAKIADEERGCQQQSGKMVEKITLFMAQNQERRQEAVKFKVGGQRDQNIAA